MRSQARISQNLVIKPQRAGDITLPIDKKALLRVSVHAPGGAHYQGEAKVILIQGNRKKALKRKPEHYLYERMLPPGKYTLEVFTPDLYTPPRSFELPPEGKTVSLYLGQQDWPFYRLGENLVPFEPRDELIAVAFPSGGPDNQQMAQDQAEQLAKSLPIEPYKDNDYIPFEAAEGAIWLFRLTNVAGLQDERKIGNEREEVIRVLRERLGQKGRVGLPVDLIPKQIKVIDNQFVVRFRQDMPPDKVVALVAGVEAKIIRRCIQADNTWLIQFQREDYREHLLLIEKMVESKLLLYGEPDIMVEIIDDAFPATAPNDSEYGSQSSLTLQNIDDAWQFLAGINGDFALGNPDIYVASIDRGVNKNHPDLNLNRMADSYDFSKNPPQKNSTYILWDSHGMGVVGIIAARTDNSIGIAGIAPNTHHIAIKRPELLTTDYYNMLLWLAGIQIQNPPDGWPGKISHPAHIINCSHHFTHLPAPGLMQDTFQTLVTQGRGGLGTVIVYAAGNDSELITGSNPLATDWRTLAIANSNPPNDNGVEFLNSTSNFGPEIDICAQGHNSMSLNRSNGVSPFGGTSAAAPMVAAAAALILSVNPNLTWTEVRDILRQTAVKIDPSNSDPNGRWIDDRSGWYGSGRLNVEAAVRE